jgi:hypothetical protein
MSAANWTFANVTLMGHRGGRGTAAEATGGRKWPGGTAFLVGYDGG